MLGVSIMSAPHRRQSLANTGHAMRGCAAIMWEAWRKIGTLTFGSSATSRRAPSPAGNNGNISVAVIWVLQTPHQPVIIQP